jgi:hypothetical protein
MFIKSLIFQKNKIIFKYLLKNYIIGTYFNCVLVSDEFYYICVNNNSTCIE